jgi:hypothetical protein
MANPIPEPIEATIPSPPGFQTQFQLVRAADQLDVGIELINLVPRPVGQAFMLHRADPSKSSGILLKLPPQHILDFASAKPTYRIVADPTRLSFIVADGQDGIPFSQEGLLAALPKLALNGHFLQTATPIKQFAIERALPSIPEFPSAFELVRTAMAAFIPFEQSAAQAHLGEEAHLLDWARRSSAQFTSMPSDSKWFTDSIAPDPSQVNRAMVSDRPEVIDSNIVSDPVPPTPLSRPPLPSQTVQLLNGQLPLTELRLSSRLVFGLWFGSQPSPGVRFNHAAVPLTHDGRTELWHTNLSQLTEAGTLVEQAQFLTVLRSEIPLGSLIGWNNDVPSKVRTLISPDRATEIAAQARPKFPIQPLRANRVHLTAHGATMEVSGEWPSSTTVKAWRHRTAIGRDQYERLVEEGRLYPFGHRAIKTQITERKIVNPTNGSPAQLFTRTFIEVLEPVLTFAGDDAIGRQFPFSTIELLSREAAGEFESLRTSNGQVIQLDTGTIKVGSQPFRYRCLAKDRAGRPVTFDVPLVFVANTFPTAQYPTLASTYQSRLDLSQIQLGEQTMAIAAPAIAAEAATPPDATEIIASLANLQVTGSGTNFRPVVSEFTARVPSIERFTAVPEQLKVAYEKSIYLVNGFSQGNPGEVLLSIVGKQPLLGLASQTVNGGLLSGVAYPVTGLSRRLGPVGGVLTDVAKDVFNPKQWLGSVLDELTLLGIVPLKALIKEVAPLAEAPKIAQSVVDGLRTQKMQWSTPLFPPEKFPVDQPQEIEVPGGFARLRAASPEAAILTVEAVVVAEADGSMTATTTCVVHQISLGIGLGPADLVQVPFEKIAFVSVNGRKPDLDVEMGNITFHGILAFLGILSRLIDRSGFHDPPALDLTANGIRSSFSTPIPNVAIGMFSLENIAFGAALEVPFQAGAPELFLNFSTFENPFRMTVSALGGGGYLGLALSAASGLQRLEGALEFGASLSINLGVAKGGVAAMGGIYFRIEAGEAVLMGYLRIAGYLSVLGLISVAVEFMLALSYESESNLLRGKAEMAIKVSVLFFSKTVRIQMERTFAGSNADPTFTELMDPPEFEGERPWNTYCLAFAD